MLHPTDLDLSAKDVAELASPDAITALLSKLGYDTSDRTVLSPEAVGLAGESASAIKYAWDRWLDGPDLNDTDTPEENPGACVVTALDAGTADWIIVTNGRLWRIYSRQAHARATNFYEVDLVEALTASGDTDPNEAFRYWWLFLRPRAFSRETQASADRCWLDDILLGSREYAKRLGDRLKDRIFLTIFPHLAQGFLVDRKQRLGQNKKQTEEELADIFEATLTLLYRLLFLLYAESRDLLPIREAPYQAASLKKIKDEIADKAGVAESDVAERLDKVYSAKDTALYDRLCTLFVAMDKGDPILNVPTYNGGLFNTKPDKSDRREQRIARFLTEHKVPDRYLALAIDHLARDQDERTLALVFIDYKSLEVRHLGSIPSSENTDWPWSEAGAKGEDVFRKTFPAIHAHFLPFKKALIERQDQGRYYWELRSCDYMGEFEKPKIVWQEMAWFTRFSVDTQGKVLNNTAYILPSVDPLIVAVLNSPLAWWFMWRTAQHGKDEVLRLIHSYIADFSIPGGVQAKLKEGIASTVAALALEMGTLQALKGEVENLGVERFSLPQADGRVVTWLTLPPETFSARLLKLAKVKQPTPKLREDVLTLHQIYRCRQVSLLTRQLELEKKLATLVEEAYGLTPEERELLRSTRPVRDPLDVLEAKIRGGHQEEVHADE